MDEELSSPAEGQFLVYQAEDGKLKIDVRFEGETVWLTRGRSGKKRRGHAVSDVGHPAAAGRRSRPKNL